MSKLSQVVETFAGYILLGCCQCKALWIHCSVKVFGNVKKAKFHTQDIEIDDQPDGGANALNINRFDP